MAPPSQPHQPHQPPKNLEKDEVSPSPFIRRMEVSVTSVVVLKKKGQARLFSFDIKFNHYRSVSLPVRDIKKRIFQFSNYPIHEFKVLQNVFKIKKQHCCVK